MYKRQVQAQAAVQVTQHGRRAVQRGDAAGSEPLGDLTDACLLYTSDAADERSSVDLGGRRILKKKKT